MKMTKRQQWLLVASAAGAVAAPLANLAVTATWKRASGDDIPDDLARAEVDWKRVLLFTAASAVVVAFAQLAAQRGAAKAWKGITGRRPPTRKYR
jgi:hypothetical protein